jgi:hypothetical protein
MIDLFDDSQDDNVMIDGILRTFSDTQDDGFILGLTNLPVHARRKIGSLVGFGSLEHLSVPSTYFLGHNTVSGQRFRLPFLLPESLISLKLQNIHRPWVFAEIKMLLQNKAVYCPKLRRVDLTVSTSTCGLWAPTSKLSLTSRTKLIELAEENQVDLFMDPLL